MATSGPERLLGRVTSSADGTHLDNGDAGEQQQQRDPLDSGQRLPEHQDAEQRRGQDLQLVGHLEGEEPVTQSHAHSSHLNLKMKLQKLKVVRNSRNICL